MKPGILLLDLDGTLADTAPDLAWALNKVLQEEGHSPLALEKIRPTVSLGAVAMIRGAFGIDEDDEKFADLKYRFLQAYSEDIGQHTVLFDGMEQLLATLDEKGAPWGIVTNKVSWLTDPLMHELGLDTRTACIVSGDTAAHPRPHPAPLLHACELLQCRPEEALYVGDARRDIEAGQRAGMATLVAAYGYLDDADDPASWKADGSVETPMQILDWLKLD